MNLTRALIGGVVLAVGGIGLFFLLYFTVFAGAEALIRLVGSLCIPPLVMSVLIGGYAILTQDESKVKNDTEED